MASLIRFELHKLFRQKSFYVCLSILLALTILNVLIGNQSPNTIVLLIQIMTNQNNPTGIDLALSSVNNSYFTTVIGIFVALFVCDDYSFHTIKNVIARGFTRTQIYFAKFIACLVGALIAYCSAIIVSFGLGSAIYGVGNITGDYFLMFATQIAVCFAVTVIVFSLSITLKSKAGSIVLFVLGSTFIDLALSLADIFFQSKEIDLSLSPYWITRMLADTSTLVNGLDGKRLAICLVCAAVYSAVFLTLGWVFTRKSER